MEPLDDWQRLLLQHKDKPLYYRQPSFGPVRLMIGDTLRVTWTLNVGNVSSVAYLNVTPMRSMTIIASCLLIEKGVAYVAIEEDGACELIYRKMPDLWQLYGAEDDSPLSLSERRAEEIPIVLY